jgi:hypothetical protein
MNISITAKPTSLNVFYLNREGCSSGGVSLSFNNQKNNDQGSFHLLDRFHRSSMDRIFVSFGNDAPRGYDGIEIGNIFHSAAFIKRLRITEVDERYQALQRTSH